MKFIKKHKAYLLVVYALLLISHFIIKDNIHPLSILFYATPLITIISFGFIINYIYFKTKLFYITLFLQITLSLIWFNNNIYFNKFVTKTTESKTILFWNLAKKKSFPKTIILSQIKDHNPDLLAFVEDKSNFIINKDSISNYSYKKLTDNMSILYKGELLDVSFYYKEENYKLNLITIKNSNKTTTYLLVDIYANPLTKKEEAHSKITSIAIKEDIDIVLGDFNTPYESIYFDNYKATYNSFRSKSNGLTATWFFGLPLLELDQIWLNKKHKPLSLSKNQYLHSDHKLLIATYLKQ